MMQEGIFGSTEHTDRVDTDMLVEALIFCINQSLEECRIHLFVFYRCTVLIEVFTNQLAIGTIYL